jgi:hypothetical protein
LALNNDIELTHSNAINHGMNYHQNCPEQICKFYKLGQLSRVEERTEDIEKGIQQLEDAFKIIAGNAEKLIYYLNSNLAESFMAIQNMMLGGRRTNNQLRGTYKRQVRMAALVMSEGYSRHAILYERMGVRPTKSMEKLSKQVQLRREKDAKRANKRHRPIKKQFNTGYKSQTFENSHPSPEELENIKIQLLEKIPVDVDDISYGKLCLSYNDARFLTLIKYRLMTTNAANILELKSFEKKPFEKFIEKCTGPPSFNTTEAKKALWLEFEAESSRKIKSCGIFINSEFPFLASKPDGYVKNTVIRILEDDFSRNAKYYDYLGKIDVICTGMSKCVMVYKDKNGKMQSAVVDPMDENTKNEKLTILYDYYYKHILDRHASLFFQNMN